MTMKATWYVYLLRCRDTTLYTGITTDLNRRVAEHNSAASTTKYTRTRQPVRLVYFEELQDRSAAGKREIAIKRLSRKKKEELVSSALKMSATD